MKTIRIAHLYYDLMNLYGESGNILALKKGINEQDQRCEINYLSIGDKIDFNKYDIFYMGCGTEDNQEIVRKDILKYKKDIEKVIDTKLFIMTGNSYELFGKSINDKECLGLYNFSSKTVDNRIVGEQVCKTYVIPETVIGFQNRGSINNIEDNHFFEVISGNEDNSKTKYEGIHINNFYGTYTLGPLLIRNPYLKNKMLKDLFEVLGLEYTEVSNTTDINAYEEYKKNFKID